MRFDSTHPGGDDKLKTIRCDDKSEPGHPQEAMGLEGLPGDPGMCDTLVSVPATLTSVLSLAGTTTLDLSDFPSVLFAKNSDREPDEAQVIVSYPGGPTRGRTVQTSHIEIPQVPETQPVLLSRPFQFWGAEMGVNAAGVAIGNEAIFTRIPMDKSNRGLTGLDLVRLGLERADSAQRALEVITQLLEQYGQDACSGYRNRNTFYHNSFLIADPHQAFVLDTFGKEWASRPVSGLHAISNGIGLTDDYTESSRGLVKLARPYLRWRRGQSADGAPLNLRAAFTAPGYRTLAQCDARISQLQTGPLAEKLQQIEGSHPSERLFAAFSLMRRHPHDDKGRMHPARATTAYVCMHANRLLVPFQTTGSMVAELKPLGQSRVWFTGTSAPCLSAYKPFYFGGEVLAETQQVIPGERADQSLWWQFERLHRQVLQSHGPVAPEIRRVMDRLEHDFVTRAMALEGQPIGPEHHQLSAQSLTAFQQTTRELLEALQREPLPRDAFYPLYSFFWERLNEQNGIMVRRG